MTLLLLFSCKHKETKENEKLGSSNSQQIDLFDSNDNCTYVGYVNKYYFQKTNEFYIELYSKRTDINFDKISKLTDSIIYKDDENVRRRIPLSIASKEFDFSGIRELTLFDGKQNELTKAHFIRVEFLEGSINSYITAVYQADSPARVNKAVYCIGNLTESLTKANYTEFSDSAMTRDIMNKLNLTYTLNLESKHYRESINKPTFSVINMDSTAQIIERLKSGYNCIYKSSEREQIFDLVFIPIIRNTKPILLIKSVVPDTDVDWNSLLVYDGTTYKPTESQRIKN